MRPKRPSPDARRVTLLHPFINKSGQSDPLPRPAPCGQSGPAQTRQGSPSSIPSLISPAKATHGPSQPLAAKAAPGQSDPRTQPAPLAHQKSGPDAPRLTLLHPFINKSGQSDPLPQPGGKSSGWRLLGACLGPAWGLLAALLANTPGREAPSGGRALFGGKSPGWGLLGALGPAQGPVEGQEVWAKTLGFRVFTFVCCLHQVWLFVALPWQGWKRPSFTWAYA